MKPPLPAVRQIDILALAYALRTMKTRSRTRTSLQFFEGRRVGVRSEIQLPPYCRIGQPHLCNFLRLELH